ncbi:MAG: hypothetical protein NTZ29_04140 [Verrucomicrobia bacterium]|nr:hypothetical protein [Verrucomicrobiota bacterium]
MESETTWQDGCSFTGQKLGYERTERVPSAHAAHVVFTKRAS